MAGRESVVKRNRMLRKTKRMKRICIFLAVFILIQVIVISAYALNDREPEPITAQSADATLEMVFSVETVAETTLPPETLPPETTVPPTTEPEETEPEPTEEEIFVFNGMPLYFQTDYPDEMYGSGTIANSGCSITSLAMVATYMTGHDYQPDELADWFGGKASNNIERLEYASEALQLPFEGPLNYDETMAAMRDGKVAIVLMESESIFTESQHFIVLAGYTDSGKIMVMDPYEPNYDHWQLKRALVEGFNGGDICKGFSGGWVYDKDSLPEDLPKYEEEKVEVEYRYEGIELTAAEKHLLAKMVWVEAQGEPFEGQQAVAEVVLNRLAADNFQDTLKGVIYADGQFRSVPKLDDAQPNQTQYEAVEQALEGPYVLPKDVVFFATYAVNKNVWGQIGGHIFCYQWD